MNEGVLSLILQWTLVCLVWMGSLDQALRPVGLRRASALALLTAFLICSFTSWQLSFLPVEVNVSGAILPLLLAGWTWHYLPRHRKVYVLTASFLCALLLFVVRKMLFWDPVLLLLDETWLVPLVAVLIFQLMTRNRTFQWFMLLVSLPLADCFYALSLLTHLGHSTLGAETSQDMFWITVAVWGSVTIVWILVQKGSEALLSRVTSLLRIRSKSNSHR